ncbi:preprotein translocase subunit SecE [Faecalicoccus acidiformans]|uniref:Preprotein translocase subunit SecE n=1 Tax=Faecalicoccus acidiformans TaxID=915173 RepID=A0A7W8D2A3_9FIRM|nr:preprotein translocase subunit SecE [Faecalicoccus acidiformans]MBB5185459.1 preprotein translocase subunit SecE [Faecalicoccus acidiformans]
MAKNKEKKEKKYRTYSPKGIIRELKQVQWPGFKGLMKSSGLVILFTLLFGLYFFICEILASGLIQVIVG